MKRFFLRYLYVLLGIAGAFGVFRCFAAGGEPVSGQPKVSIIVPVYNVEEYLPECLNSLISQTLQDIEIICVDDGSPDRSPEILEEYAKKDKRIKVIHKKNGGLSSARNAGLEVARGKYLFHVDSDDYLEKEACEIAFRKAEELNADILVFGWDNVPVSTNRKACSPKAKVYHQDEWFKAKRKRASIRVWNKLYKAQFIKDNNLKFCEKIRCANDEDYNLRAYPLAKVIAFIPDILYHYRYREGSLVFTTRKILSEYLEVWQHVIYVWKHNNYNISPKIYFKLITYPVTYRGEFGDFVKTNFKI